MLYIRSSGSFRFSFTLKRAVVFQVILQCSGQQLSVESTMSASMFLIGCSVPKWIQITGRSPTRGPLRWKFSWNGNKDFRPLLHSTRVTCKAYDLSENFSYEDTWPDQQKKTKIMTDSRAWHNTAFALSCNVYTWEPMDFRFSRSAGRHEICPKFYTARFSG